MAAGKEIRGKIKSVENTKRSPKAMEMVAASKMRKAQDRMRLPVPTPRPSATLHGNLWPRPILIQPPVHAANDGKAVGIIVVTTDKGLCGGLNTNVLRAVTNKLRSCSQVVMATDAVAIGNKAWLFEPWLGARWFRMFDVGLGDTPTSGQTDRPGQVLLDAYVEGEDQRGLPGATASSSTP